MQARSAGWKTALGWAGLAVAVACLSRALAETDLRAAAGLIGRAGPALLVAFVPFAVTMAVDAAGFRLVFAAVGRRVAFTRLWLVRFSSEAVSLSVPAGALAAESLHPWLLHRRCGVAARDAIAAIAGKRWMVMRAHAVYITAAALAGWPLFSRVSPTIVHGAWLPYAVLATAALPLVAGVSLEGALTRGRVAQRVHALAARLPLTRTLGARKAAFDATDESLARLASRSARTATTAATLVFVGAWLMEAIETLVILRVLGADVSVVEGMALEGGVSILRSVGFFAPGGLGVTDLGYVALLRAMGIADADAVAPAFVVVKRAKDLAYSVFGWSLIGALAAKGKPSAEPLPFAGAQGGETAS